MNRQEILRFFKDLKFNETEHKYLLNDKTLRTSVSQMCKHYQNKADFQQISYQIDNRDNLEIGTTQKFWKNKSELALARGTKTHFFAEVYMFNKHLKPTDKYEAIVKKFIDEIPSHLVPVCTELVMYHKEFLYAGTCDLLMYNTKTNKYIIADYKTNENIFKNFMDKKLLSPFNFLLDSAFNLYQIQLNLYEILFNQTGFEVESKKVIWLKENEYLMYDAIDLKPDLIKELKRGL